MPGRSRPSRNAVLEFKSHTLTVPVLLLMGNDESAIEKALRRKLEQSAEFFRHSPILIDLHQINRDERSLDLERLLTQLRRHSFQPIGVRGATEEQAEVARGLGLSAHMLGAAMTQVERVAAQKAARRALREGNIEAAAAPAPEAAVARAEPAPAPASAPENRIVTEPVRSGQRLFARGDLIVTSTVSPGAELVAEGNIHVYGSLRGRALAGVPGNAECRIFCLDLQAELISIAGIYQLREEAEVRERRGPVSISLEDQRLVIRDI